MLTFAYGTTCKCAYGFAHTDESVDVKAGRQVVRQTHLLIQQYFPEAHSVSAPALIIPQAKMSKGRPGFCGHL